MVNHQDHVLKPQSGFTLIEMLIVVGILALLAAIAYPSYTKYMKRGYRADVMSEMQQMAGRIEASKINYKRYDKIPLTAIFTEAPSGNKVQYLSNGTPIYEITITPVSGNKLSSKNWVLTATPLATSKMKGDGNLTIDASGRKCWKSVCGMEDQWRN